MKKPLVSVIIASLNGHNTVGRAINSALNQFYRPLEIIVIDDCSSPPLKDALEGGGDDSELLKVLRLETNSGSYAARDAGIRASRGEYIAILDDDDEWLPNKLSIQVPLLLKDSNIGLVCCGSIDIYPHNKPMIRVPRWGNIPHNRFLAREWIINSSVVYRRSIYEEIGGYDTTMRRCGDWDFHIRLSKHYKVVGLNQTLLLTHMKPGSLQRSTDVEAYAQDRYNVMKKHAKNLKKECLWEEALAWHYYSIGVRYFKAKKFSDAREYMKKSIHQKPHVASLTMLVLAQPVLNRFYNIARFFGRIYKSKFRKAINNEELSSQQI